MRPTSTTALLLASALLLGGCVTTSTTSTTWGERHDEPAPWRYGHVESIRETVHRQEGNPGAGAAVGAVIGAIIGGSDGHGHRDAYGRRHRHGGGAGGAVAGAVVGAVIGAAASQGSAEQRTYEVLVRFEDGAVQSFPYVNGVPFRVGDEVALGPDGLVRL